MEKFWIFNFILFATCSIISCFQGDIDKLAVIMMYISMIIYKLDDIQEKLEGLDEATKKTKEE